MYEFKIVLSENTNEVLETIANYPTLATNAIKRNVEPIFKKMLSELVYVPPFVAYPIDWTSEAQREAFFASNGFGKGIPTKRTSDIVKAWKRVLKQKKNSTYMAIENSIPEAIYVQGQWQQNFHMRTGWNSDFAVFDKFSFDLEKAFVKAQTEVIALVEKIRNR